MDIFFSILQSILAIYGVLYLATAIFRPAFFLDFLSVNEMDRRGVPKYRVWFLIASTWLAVGVVLYAAMYAVVAAIPESWGGYGEEGEWESARRYFQMFGAFWGTLFVTLGIEEIAKKLLWADVRRKVADALIDTLTSYGVEADKAIEVAKEKVKKNLAVDEFEPTSWATELQEEHCRHIQSTLDNALNRKTNAR